MLAHLRLKNIEAEVRRHGSCSFDKLLQQFKISPATLRRDLTQLEADGKLVRTHGGVMHPTLLRGEPDFSTKAASQIVEKKKIALQVTAAVPDRVAIFVDGGTTCIEAAKLLLGRPSLTVITNSVPILSLGSHAEAKVIAIGGELRKVSSALVGSNALQTLGILRAEIALIGASAVDERQAFTSELSEAAVKQHMMERARKSWLLIDLTKRKATAPIAFALLSQFERVITEEAGQRSRKAKFTT